MAVDLIFVWEISLFVADFESSPDFYIKRKRFEIVSGTDATENIANVNVLAKKIDIDLGRNYNY